MEYQLQGNCYVVARGRDDEKSTYMDMLTKHKEDLVLFPESKMRFIDTVSYLPYDKSIVTENPFLISSYDKYKVWVLSDGEWINPNHQTFGQSIESITSNIIGYDSSIPVLPYIKLRSLLGDIPKGVKTYQDYVYYVQKKFAEFNYEM